MRVSESTPMPPWITKESHRPRVSHRTMSYRLAGRITVTLVSFQETDGAVTTVEMEPQAGRTLSPIHTTKLSNGFLKKTTRRSRVHVQTIGLNAETKKLRHRADAALCLLTFPFIGLLRLPRLPGLESDTGNPLRPKVITSRLIGTYRGS